MKLPRHPPAALTIDDSDLTDWPHPVMVRIHGGAGPFTLAWHELRHFGPTPTRFDPHPAPPGYHADYAVLYAAADIDTALAEVFQRGRVVEPAAPNRPTLTIWEPPDVWICSTSRDCGPSETAPPTCSTPGRSPCAAAGPRPLPITRAASTVSSTPPR